MSSLKDITRDKEIFVLELEKKVKLANISGCLALNNTIKLCVFHILIQLE